MLTFNQKVKILMGITLLGGLTSFSASAQEQVYLYHPNSTMALGRGFEPNILSEPKINCLDFKRKSDVQNGAATNTTFLMRTVSSREELKRKLGVDFNLDARYLSASASTNFDLDKESNFEEHTLNVLVVASSEYGSVSMDNPQLTASAKQMIDNGHHDLFKSQCGSHLVTNEIMGVRVGVLLTIRNVSSKTADEMKAGMSLEYKTGAMDLKFKTSLSNLVNQASATNSLEISIYATGSTGVDKLGGLAKVLSAQEGALDKIQEELGNYLKEFSASNAVAIRFMAKPFGFGYEAKYENLWKAHYERKIQRIAEVYRKLDYQIDTAGKIKEDKDLRAMLMTEEEIDNLYEEMLAAQDYLDELVELHNSCQKDVYSQTKPDAVNDGTKKIFCDFNSAEVPYLKLPAIPDVPLLAANSGGTEDRGSLNIEGYGIAEYIVVANQVKNFQVVSQQKFAAPNAVVKETRVVDLNSYWKHVSSQVQGQVKGYVVIRDFFNRTIIYKFHHATYPELGGTEAYFDVFIPEGVEETWLP